MAHGVGLHRSSATGELVRQATGGDQSAWNVLVERYSGMLWSIARAYGLGTPDAMDVVQTTWLRLIENVDRLRDPDRVGTWLAITARRESLRAVRLLAKERAVPRRKAADPARPPIDDPSEIAVARERQRLLVSTINRLPERCRRLIRLLTTVPAVSYAEISAALDMPIGSIGPTRARCLSQIRKRLTGRMA
jgi:RNA polymerase sigma factor (sigma-70 family)